VPLDQDLVAELARREVVYERARLGPIRSIPWLRAWRLTSSDRDELSAARRLRIPREAVQSGISTCCEQNRNRG